MSGLEDLLASHIKIFGLPEPIREYSAIPGRRFRWDFAWPEPEYRLLVEVQGATWVKGAHSTGTGIARDCAKNNMAVLEGYRCILVVGEQIKNGDAIEWIKKALAKRLH